MSFIVRKTAQRPWPVSVTLLESDKSGTIHETINTFVANFRTFTEEEFEAARAWAEEKIPFLAKEGAAPITGDSDIPVKIVLARNAMIFGEFIVGWGDEVKDEQGQPIAFSPEILTAMVTGPDGAAVSRAIHTALSQLRYGYAPEKNVETSPAPGPTPDVVDGAPTN